MNITGGSNLSLYEVQEAADIVASTIDKELNMIFGSIINENLKDEIMITVIATGFVDKEGLSTNSREEILETQSRARPNHDRTIRQDPVHDRARYWQQQDAQVYTHGQQWQESEDRVYDNARYWQQHEERIHDNRQQWQQQEERVQDKSQQSQQLEESLDIPTFLRNRNKRYK